MTATVASLLACADEGRHPAVGQPVVAVRGVARPGAAQVRGDEQRAHHVHRRVHIGDGPATHKVRSEGNSVVKVLRALSYGVGRTVGLWMKLLRCHALPLAPHPRVAIAPAPRPPVKRLQVRREAQRGRPRPHRRRREAVQQPRRRREAPRGSRGRQSCGQGSK